MSSSSTSSWTPTSRTGGPRSRHSGTPSRRTWWTTSCDRPTRSSRAAPTSGRCSSPTPAVRSRPLHVAARSTIRVRRSRTSPRSSTRRGAGYSPPGKSEPSPPGPCGSFRQDELARPIRVGVARRLRLDEGEQVHRLHRQLACRTAEEVALPGTDAQAQHRFELLQRLDALGDGRASALTGHRPERLEDRLRWAVLGPRADQRQVDLHDVEVEVAEQAEAGIPGADIVDGDTDAVPPQAGDGLLEPAQVLDRLAL